MAADLLGGAEGGSLGVDFATGAAKTGDVAGLASAATDAIDRAGPLLPLRDAEQLDLLRDGKGSLGSIEAKSAPRGVGRPKGAKNRRTTTWAEYLTSRYAHPLEVLAQLITRPIDAIVAETGCKPIEALTLIKSAAAELAPYVASKMPVLAVVDHGADLGMLVIEGVTHSREELGDILAGEFVEVDDDDEETAENRHSEGGE